MTYSHNRVTVNRNNAERYAHGTSPPNNFFGHGGVHSNRKANQARGTWQRSHGSNSNSLSTSRCGGQGNAILSPQSVSSISTPVTNATSRSGGARHSGNKSNNHHQRTNGVQALNGAGPANGLFGRISPISSLPTITHFAGSKCFDAPAPTALPKPPQHWTTSGVGVTFALPTEPSSAGRAQVMKTARRSLIDDFGTHSLKLLLNVQS